MWSMVAQRLTQITPPAATPDQLWQRLVAAWSAVPQEHIQSLFESMPRRVAFTVASSVDSVKAVYAQFEQTRLSPNRSIPERGLSPTLACSARPNRSTPEP
ncbi:transposable element Tcb1 transposase [Trichonephila clavipes]|nr:transposable element Tcb1 transposase [Trichonephila clavipes]